MKKVIVFIPAFNEEATVASVINRILETHTPEITGPKGYLVEVLIVDDGSADRTAEIAAAIKNVHLVRHVRNLGLGAATRTGMETAHELGADVAIKIDADFQHDPDDIDRTIAPILAGRADICWGSRFAGKINYRMPLIRRVGNRFFTWLMNTLTEYTISDAQTGMMAFNRKYLGIFEIHGNYNPPQQLLIDANIKHMRYAEVPVVFHPRTAGKSFVSLKYPFYVFTNIFRILVYANPLKVFSILGAGLMLFSILYFIVSTQARKHHWAIADYLIQNVSLVTVIIGLQVFLFGILADIIVKKRK